MAYGGNQNDDYKSFRDCVLNLGTEWHVIRTVEKDNQDNFCKNLWDNRKKFKMALIAAEQNRIMMLTAIIARSAF